MPYRNHHTSYLCQVISLSRTVIILYTWTSNSSFSFVSFLHLKVSKIHSFLPPPLPFSVRFITRFYYIFIHGRSLVFVLILWYCWQKGRNILFLILQLWMERISKKNFFWKTKIDINSLKLVHFNVFWVVFFLLFNFHI